MPCCSGACGAIPVDLRRRGPVSLDRGLAVDARPASVRALAQSGLAGPLADLVTLYLTFGAVAFPQDRIWDVYAGSLLARWSPLFYLTEFLG